MSRSIARRTSLTLSAPIDSSTNAFKSADVTPKSRLPTYTEFSEFVAGLADDSLRSPPPSVRSRLGDAISIFSVLPSTSVPVNAATALSALSFSSNDI